MSKLTAFQIWKKVKDEGLSKEEYKKLLIDNDVIIPKDFDVCEICHGKGYYSYGGSFGGGVITEKCSCQN